MDELSEESGLLEEPPGEPAQTNGNGHSHESLGERVGDWFEHTLGGGDASGDAGIGLSEMMARALDTMQAQIARVQMALDPPELVIRIPRDACLFYEFWRAAELIDIGRVQAEKALDTAGY